MDRGRRRTVTRVAAVVATLALVGLMGSGVASAGVRTSVGADEGSGGSSQPNDPVGGVVGSLTGGSSGTSSGSSGSGSSESPGSGRSSSGSGSSSSGSSSSSSSGSGSSITLPTDALNPVTGSSSNGLLSPNALISIPSSITTFPSFPTTLPTIPGLPDLTGTDPTTACSQVVSTLSGLDPTGLSSALQSPAATFCGALGFTLPSLPGTTTTSSPSTEIIYAPPQYYGPGKSYTGNHYWDSGYGHRYCSCSSGSSYSPAAVTQVTTMPKGGVDTGDGSTGP